MTTTATTTAVTTAATDRPVMLQFSCGRRSVSDEPGKEEGPLLAFPGYVDVTYSTIRHEGEVVAFLNKDGDWEIDAAHEGAGETYSDVTIFPATPDGEQPGPDLTVRPTATCGCGYELVWVNNEWQHDAAPGLWGDDHDPDAPDPDPAHAHHWNVEDGIDVCRECHNTIAAGDYRADYGMCGSCLHDAKRAGWTPGKD